MAGTSMKAKWNPAGKLDASSCPLDRQLRTHADEYERIVAFKELVKIHGQSLVSEARRQAFILGLDASAGDAAMSDAFIRLAKALDEPWPRERSFLLRFRGEIRNELRHRRAKMAKLRVRFPLLNDEDHTEASLPDPERQYLSNERLHMIWESLNRLTRTDQQLRLAVAWRLSKLEYAWDEIKTEIKWAGSSDSLRVSVSRFFNQRKSRLLNLVG